MLYFGIDWSERQHNVCLRNEAGAVISRLVIDHSLAGFERIENERRKLGVPASECLVAIETAHNLLVDYLLDHGYQIYLVAPQATASYRNRQRLSGAHDDDSDAALLSDIVRTDRASHRPWRSNQPLTQQMLAQIRMIEMLRNTIQREQSQLRAMLLRSYPAALGLFGKLTAEISLQFLAAYPSAQAAQALSREEFERFCREHGYTRTKLIVKRYGQLQVSQPSANPAISQAYQGLIRTWAELLLPQVRSRRQALAQLKRLFAAHPDAAIFDSLPGAGELLAPALLAKFGDDRERFPEPGGVQALAGTCPVTERSGQRRHIHYRLGCDREFRRISQQFALASLAQSSWAAAYWDELRPHCRSDSHALRILANRWLAIIWKLWQSHEPYDEAYHLQQRARRRQPRA